MTGSDNDSKGAKALPSAQTDTPRRTISKTPMFTAMHSARYERQDLIKAIDEAEQTNLICYVCGNHTEIDRNDIIGFVDLLHNIPRGQPIDLLLHTCGGDVDACEKLIDVVHAKAAEAPFRVIVPDMAKSSGTFMALRADSIIMSDTSELGKIDPQFILRDSQGNELWHSVIDYLEAFEEHSRALAANPKDPVALLMLDHFDAKIVRKFQGIRDRVRTFAEDQLKRHGLPASAIVSELMGNRWRTHSQPISAGSAAQFGLPVEYLQPGDARWMRYWRLYCLQRIEVLENKKIYESAYVSQVVGD